MTSNPEAAATRPSALNRTCKKIAWVLAILAEAVAGAYLAVAYVSIQQDWDNYLQPSTGMELLILWPIVFAAVYGIAYCISAIGGRGRAARIVASALLILIPAVVVLALLGLIVLGIVGMGVLGL